MKKRVDNRVCFVYSSYCSDAEQLTYATVAQLVEYDLAKVGVAGSNPVYRSYRTVNRKIYSPFFLFKFCFSRYFCYFRKIREAAIYSQPLIFCCPFRTSFSFILLFLPEYPVSAPVLPTACCQPYLEPVSSDRRHL